MVLLHCRPASMIAAAPPGRCGVRCPVAGLTTTFLVHGNVAVGVTAALSDDEALGEWVDHCLAFAGSLPPK